MICQNFSQNIRSEIWQIMLTQSYKRTSVAPRLTTLQSIVFCTFNPKTAEGGGGGWPPSGFSKSVSSKEKKKPWFFVIFNIILRHIFPENFIEFPQVVQKI